MKLYLKYMLFFVAGIVIVVSGVTAKDGRPLYGKIIYIDPGHGGYDPGTVYGNIYEKDINLNISLKLKKEIEKHGGYVYLTRNGDYDLSSPSALFRKKSDFDNRVRLINNEHPDLYLSIHMNYLNDSRYFGPQVFYNLNDENLAIKVQKSLNKITKSDRKIKLIPKDTYMYKKLKVSGLLVECGFLSNKKERENLLSTIYQQKISRAIVEGIITHFQSKE